jgi:hypothetical protein
MRGSMGGGGTAWRATNNAHVTPFSGRPPSNGSSVPVATSSFHHSVLGTSDYSAIRLESESDGLFSVQVF